MKKHILQITGIAIICLFQFMSANAQEAFQIYHSNGMVSAFLKEDIDSITYSNKDLGGHERANFVVQEVHLQDTIYRFPLAKIDSVAFKVNDIRVSEAYVPVEEDGYSIIEADTLLGRYILEYYGTLPDLQPGNILTLENDTLAEMVTITAVEWQGSRAAISSVRASLGDVFAGGTFTLSTETPPQYAGRKAPSHIGNVYYPVEVSFCDDSNRRHRVRRSDMEFSHRLYEKSIDYSGKTLHETAHTKLYLETCRFDFNLDLVMTCNFSSLSEGIDKYRHGELAMQKAVIRGNVETDFMVRFDASASKKEQLDEILLKANIHKPVWAKFVVAGVPVVVVMNTNLLADGSYDMSGSFSAYTGFATSTTAELGLSWSQASGLKPYSSFNTSFDFHKPTVEGEAHLECKASVFPRITFSLYALTGPSFDIKPYLKPTLDLGVYDQMGSNKKDFYGAKFNLFTGYDAAVGISSFSLFGNDHSLMSPSFNVVNKLIYEAPVKVAFEEASEDYYTPDEPLEVWFKVTDRDHLFNEDCTALLPFVVKFETNSGTLSSDFSMVDTENGLAKITWTPSDVEEPYLLAQLHDHEGNVITADRWKPKKKDAPLCPDGNHPHMIDLGIGTLWSCCNVGASSPEGYGGYYAWGETSEKSYYGPSTYQHAVLDDNNGNLYDNGHYYRYVDIGSEISGTGYDAATANWGAPWRMPTVGQIETLVNSCSYQWTQVNGVNGGKFTGPNGNSIFLPAAGSRWNDHLSREGINGNYWSGTLDPDGSGNAYHLGFSSYNADWYSCALDGGLSVRPVTENPE